MPKTIVSKFKTKEHVLDNHQTLLTALAALLTMG